MQGCSGQRAAAPAAETISLVQPLTTLRAKIQGADGSIFHLPQAGNFDLQTVLQGRVGLGLGQRIYLSEDTRCLAAQLSIEHSEIGSRYLADLLIEAQLANGLIDSIALRLQIYQRIGQRQRLDSQISGKQAAALLQQGPGHGHQRHSQQQNRTNYY